MGIFNATTENKLNDLINRAYDANSGFKRAAVHVDNPRLKSFFSEKVKERSELISELTGMLKKTGMNVNKDKASTSGSLSSAWIDTEAFFSMDNDEAIIKAVKKGDKQAVKDYDAILESCELNPTVRDMMLKQRVAIRASHDKVIQL